jgi:NitT/TauT family transport system substrate-binding protein
MEFAVTIRPPRLALLIAPWLFAGAACATAAAPQAAAPAAAPAATAAVPTAGVPVAAAPRPADKVIMSPGLSGTSYAPLFVALERGYFREEGVELEDPQIGNSTLAQVIPALAAGQIEVAGGATSAGFFNAIAQGVNVRIALDQTTAFPGNEANGVLVRKDLLDSGRVRDPSDLRGLRVGIPTKGHSTEMLLDTLLGRGGLGLQDVETVEIPYPEMNLALANSNLDAAVSIEPFAAIATNAGYAVRWKTWSEVLPYDAVAVVLFGPGFADGRTDVAKRFAKGWVRGARDFESARTKSVDREEIIAILQKYTALKDRALYDTMPWASINPDGRVNGEAVAAAQDWFAAHGYVSRPVDLGAVLDPRFADYAVEQLGPYRP